MIEPTDQNTPRTALVTGASEGIGCAFARGLTAAGYHVTAVARTEAKRRTLTGQLGQGHGYLVADLATHQGQDTVVAAMSRTRFNLLVNNAGASVYGPFAEVDLPDIRRLLRLNCEALISVAHTYLVRARPGDALINVSSTLAQLPMPRLST